MTLDTSSIEAPGIGGRHGSAAGGVGEAALALAGVSKTYQATRHSAERRALDAVSLSVWPGEWVSLLGPNGSGKSTLVRMVSGADVPDRGTVRVFGIERGSGTGRRAAARIGVVFQRPGLDALLSARENLEAQAALFGLRGAQAAARIERVSAQLGLAERMGDRISTLSGGFQRRVDLARALLHEPDILILDEATSGLDHQSRSGFLDAVDELRAQTRPGASPMTILMTTHMMDEAERSGRVVMMAAGRVVADGSPAELRASCGGRLVRAAPGTGADGTGVDAERIRKVMQDAGLVVSAGERGAMIGRDEGGGVEAIERAAAGLVRLGVAFEVAPPNLGDAYVSMTGVGLEHESPAEPARGRRGRR